jgi:DNA polymerase-3 subunit delta'
MKLYERLQTIANSPRFEWQTAYALSDELAPPNAEQRLEIFFDLLLGLINSFAREAARVEASPLWAELWEWVVREKDDVFTLNLDRRALILEALSRLSSLART